MAPTTVDLDDHESRGRYILAVVGVEVFLGTIAILCRTYTTFRVTAEGPTWPFIWASLAWASLIIKSWPGTIFILTVLYQIAGIVNCAAVSKSVSYGMGSHISSLSEEAITNAIKWSWVTDAMSRVSLAAGRTAVVAFIYEIQGKQASPWRKVFLWVVAVSNTVFNLFLAFFMIFRCTPYEYLWNKSIPDGRCSYESFNTIISYIFVGYGAFSDLVLACYPATFVMVLQMPLRKKIGVSILMGMGVVACVCAIMTTYNLSVVGGTPDPTYNMTPLTIWAVTELWTILITSSVAPLWPLLKQLSCFNKLRNGSASSTRRMLSRDDRASVSDSILQRKQDAAIMVTHDINIGFEVKNDKPVELFRPV